MSVFYLAGKSHLVEVYGDEALDLSCCGNPLKELKPNTVDAAQEKHVPVPTYDAAKHEVSVSVGSVAHPMTEEHRHQLGYARHEARHAARRSHGSGCTDRYVPPRGRRCAGQGACLLQSSRTLAGRDLSFSLSVIS